MFANELEGFTVTGDSNALNLCTFVENREVHLHKEIVKGGWTYKDLLQRARRITFETPVLIICGINDVRKIKSNSSFKANGRMLFNRLGSSNQIVYFSLITSHVFMGHQFEIRVQILNTFLYKLLDMTPNFKLITFPSHEMNIVRGHGHLNVRGFHLLLR